MRTLIPAVCTSLLIAVGCQKPCTKTTSTNNSPSEGEIGFVTKRDFADCGDTLNYREQVFQVAYSDTGKTDTVIVSEGQFLNGQKDGKWIYFGRNRQETVYRNGFEVEIRDYSKDGKLMIESILGADSLYAEKQFYANGKVESEQFTNLNGYLTGHGILYDSTGRKLAEGDHISEDVLPDTVYIENPEPPYDLQQIIITENGGKHGPWVYYGFDGTIIDTVNFDKGKAVWGGSEVGKWKLEEIVNGNPTDSTKEVLMNIPDFVGYEFTADGKLGAFNTKGQTSNWGTYSWNPDGSSLYVFDNKKEGHAIFLFDIDKESMKFAIGTRIFHLKRVG